MRRPGCWLLLGWLSLAGQGGEAAEPLAERVEAVLATPGYERGRWGILVVDRATGEVVYERNPDQLFCPASVTKLYSCAAALLELGPDYRFKTVLRGPALAADGILAGNLVLVASGDPSLGGRTGPDGTLLFTTSDHSYAGGHHDSVLVSTDPLAPLAGLDALARDVAESGVKAVTGDLIVDDRLFEPAPSTGSGPSRVSPIIVNDNLVDILVSPGKAAGDPAVVSTIPATAFVGIDAQVSTSAEGTKPAIRVVPVGPRRFSVRGQIPVGHAPVVKIYEVEEPASFARALLIESLMRRGVQVSASPLATNNPGALPSRAEVEALPLVAEYNSPPLRESVKVILKVSQNLHASLLPMLLAVRGGGRTLEAGLRRQGEILKALGLDVGSISFGGGAGGSRSDLVTPRATVSLIRALASRSDLFPVIEAALPVLGRDGTLSKAVEPDSPVRGHVRAKTGTYWVDNGLNGHAILTSKALAGTLETASGRVLDFAFFLNDLPLDVPADDVSDATTRAGQLLGRLCAAFYEDRPAAEEPASTPPPAAAADNRP